MHAIRLDPWKLILTMYILYHTDVESTDLACLFILLRSVVSDNLMILFILYYDNYNKNPLLFNLRASQYTSLQHSALNKLLINLRGMLHTSILLRFYLQCWGLFSERPKNCGVFHNRHCLHAIYLFLTSISLTGSWQTDVPVWVVSLHLFIFAYTAWKLTSLVVL